MSNHRGDPCAQYVSSRYFLRSPDSLSSPNAQAKGKKPKPAPKDPSDSIEVVGHISLPDGPVTRFVATQHYSSYYLYAEHENGKNVTLIDVTHIERPVVLAEVPYPVNGGSATLFQVAGTAALVTEGAAAASPAPQGQTIRIMDFSESVASQGGARVYRRHVDEPGRAPRLVTFRGERRRHLDSASDLRRRSRSARRSTPGGFFTIARPRVSHTNRIGKSTLD